MEGKINEKKLMPVSLDEEDSNLLFTCPKCGNVQDWGIGNLSDVLSEGYHCLKCKTHIKINLVNVSENQPAPATESHGKPLQHGEGRPIQFIRNKLANGENDDRWFVPCPHCDNIQDWDAYYDGFDEYTGIGKSGSKDPHVCPKCGGKYLTKITEIRTVSAEA
jgi:predicted RNA-binding Zn-ribbon protein involved in translation (DUF1610 family)